MRMALIALLLAACGVEPSTGSGGVAPLRLVEKSSGTERMVATIAINGVALDAFVDTGSSGLRIMPGALDDDTYASVTDQLVSYSYHSGLALQGVVATAPVTIGGLTTPSIPVMQIRTVGCVPGDDDCNTNGFGYPAILGIGMRNLPGSGNIANPIVQLDGHPAYAVHVDRDAQAGALTIGASDAGFTLVDLPLLDGGAPLADGTEPRDDRTVPACVTDATHGTQLCAGAILDTGCGPVEMLRPSYTGADQEWTPGTAGEVAVADAERYGFTVGPTPTPGIDEVLLEPRPFQTVDMINVGTAAFFHGDVYFDEAGGKIGVTPAQPAPTPKRSARVASASS